MKRNTLYITLSLLGLLLFASCRTQEYTVRGPEGGIAFEVTLPDGFDTAKGLAKAGIASHPSASTSTGMERAKGANRT